MKAGILTFQNANNYGAVLQAYALQKYLNENNINCEFINYNMVENKDINKKEIIIFKLKNKFIFIKNINIYIKQKKFDEFRKKYLKINSKEYYNDKAIYNNKFDYDLYIVGSDQVWNSKITNNSKVFFLTFADSKIKISYGASFGHDVLNKEEKENVKNYLKDFDAISVREKQVVNKLKNITKKEIYDVVDPVFLLETEKWDEIMKKIKINKKYIFIYLMEENKEVYKILNSINKDFKYEVIYISNHNLELKNYNSKKLKKVGPREFIYLIKNSEYVITNSFHGTAFSIIFEKKFWVIGHSKYNARIQNLINLILENNKIIIQNEENYAGKMINGFNANKEMLKEIKKSKTFIQDNIIRRI